MLRKLEISIIGAGKVGTALGLLAVRAGAKVRAVADVRRAAAIATAKMIRGAKVMSPLQAASAADIVFLTVPDDLISHVCENLATADAFRDGAIVAHCSGALGADVLSAAKKACSAKIGSMHPLQTFPTVAAAISRLPGSFYFIEGDRSATTVLARLAKKLGGHPVGIKSANKVLYHAAAVCACNYLSSLMDISFHLAKSAGISAKVARQAFAPIVQATVDNVFSLGTEKSLTGPIARGDVVTVARHIESIHGRSKIAGEIYRSLGRWTIDLARRKGTITTQQAARLTKIISQMENAKK